MGHLVTAEVKEGWISLIGNIGIGAQLNAFSSPLVCYGHSLPFVHSPHINHFSGIEYFLRCLSAFVGFGNGKPSGLAYQEMKESERRRPGCARRFAFALANLLRGIAVANAAHPCSARIEQLAGLKRAQAGTAGLLLPCRSHHFPLAKRGRQRTARGLWLTRARAWPVQQPELSQVGPPKGSEGRGYRTRSQHQTPGQ